MSGRRIVTVTGEIDASSAGFTLPHEHVMVDFIGADLSGPHRYDADDVIRTMLPPLRDAAASGVKTFIECTPMGLGRDPLILAALSERSGLNIVANTGQYKGIHVPAASRDKGPRDLADEWIAEFRDGIGETGIRPGFIKTAVETGEMDAMEEKLLSAAALASAETGMVIATHCGSAAKGRTILDLLGRFGVAPDRWILVHAQKEDEVGSLADLAERGAWIELDGIGWGNDERHVDYCLELWGRGQGGRILLSHDAGWYRVGEPGGTPKPFTPLIDRILPELRNRGLSEAETRRLTVDNPAEAFAVSA